MKRMLRFFSKLFMQIVAFIKSFRKDPMIEYKRGNSWEFVGDLRNKDGTPFDLTGWTVHAQLRREAHGAANRLIATLEGEVRDAVNGIYSIRAPIEDTETWPLGRAVFDLCFVSPNGMRANIEGMIRVNIIDPATQLGGITT